MTLSASLRMVILGFCVFLFGRLLCIRKTYTKMDQIRFFRVFSILWVQEWSRFVWPNPFELFVTGLQTDLVPNPFAPVIRICKRISHAEQLLLHLANDAARTQIHNDLCQECGGYCQGYGRIEAHSFSLERRERTLAARSAVLEMLEVKEDTRFGRLDDDSAKVKWMWRVYP